MDHGVCMCGCCTLSCESIAHMRGLWWHACETAVTDDVSYVHPSAVNMNLGRLFVYMSLSVVCVSAYGAVLPDVKWMNKGKNELIICWKGLKGRHSVQCVPVTVYLHNALSGVLGALRRTVAVVMTVARWTPVTRRQTVVARRTQRAARVGLGLIAGQLRLSGHVLTTRTLTTDDVTHWTRRAQVVAVTRCTHPHSNTCQVLELLWTH